MVMGSFTRKYREKGFRQEAVIKEGVIGHGFIHKNMERRVSDKKQS